jgi:hypothetical protein
MSDITTTFRTQSAPEPEPTAKSVIHKDVDSFQKTEVEPTFTMYKADNKLPFTADYLDVKLTWDQADMVDDIMAIEDYLKKLVIDGEVADSPKIVGQKLKSLEKMAGIDKLESQAQRLIKLAEFVTYLQKLDERKHGTIL